MKKIFVFFITFIAFFMTGCGPTEHNSTRNIEISEKFYDNFFSENVPVDYVKFTNFESTGINGEVIPESCQVKIRELQTDLLEYLNTEFHVNWTAAEINGYYTNVSEEITDTVLNYKAFYYKGNMYFDKVFFSSDVFLEDDLSRYVTAHELIHYFYEVNTTGRKFYLANENGESIGNYLEEAFVDELALRYSNYKGAKIQNTSSGYVYIRTAIEALSISCPDIFTYFFTKDIEGLEKYLDEMIAKRIVVRGSASRKFFKMIDCCQLCPTDNNKSRLVTFLIEMTPKNKYEKLKQSLDGVIIVNEDYERYMR